MMIILCTQKSNDLLSNQQVLLTKKYEDRGQDPIGIQIKMILIDLLEKFFNNI
jgi:hypothetical protein